MTVLSDHAQLQKVAAGDHSACRQLVQHYLGRVVTFAQRMLNDPIEAQDVAQEAFFKLWRMADHWQPEATLDTWLHKVTHNLCIDRLRKKQESLPGDLPEIVDTTPTPLDQHKQVAHAMAQALGKLPKGRRCMGPLPRWPEQNRTLALQFLDISPASAKNLQQAAY